MKIDLRSSVMCDLETMGNGPNAAITSIGLTTFDEAVTLRVSVALDSAVLAGGVMDASTVLWWMKQSDEARSRMAHHAIPILSALDQVDDFYDEVTLHCGHAGITIWGNGATFDNVIIRSAYQRLGRQPPWPFWSDRCFRTLKNLYPQVAEPAREGTHHDALDDAVHQARWAVKIFSEVTA